MERRIRLRQAEPEGSFPGPDVPVPRRDPLPRQGSLRQGRGTRDLRERQPDAREEDRAAPEEGRSFQRLENAQVPHRIPGDPCGEAGNDPSPDDAEHRPDRRHVAREGKEGGSDRRDLHLLPGNLEPDPGGSLPHGEGTCQPDAWGRKLQPGNRYTEIFRLQTDRSRQDRPPQGHGSGTPAQLQDRDRPGHVGPERPHPFRFDPGLHREGRVSREGSRPGGETFEEREGAEPLRFDPGLTEKTRGTERSRDFQAVPELRSAGQPHPETVRRKRNDRLEVPQRQEGRSPSDRSRRPSRTVTVPPGARVPSRARREEILSPTSSAERGFSVFSLSGIRTRISGATARIEPIGTRFRNRESGEMSASRSFTVPSARPGTERDTPSSDSLGRGKKTISARSKESRTPACLESSDRTRFFTAATFKSRGTRKTRKERRTATRPAAPRTKRRSFRRVFMVPLRSRHRTVNTNPKSASPPFPLL